MGYALPCICSCIRSSRMLQGAACHPSPPQVYPLAPLVCHYKLYMLHAPFPPNLPASHQLTTTYMQVGE
jgi:hypothetical protein